MYNDFILKIQDQFLNDMKNSKELIVDLARLEKYISESYYDRSIIELLQNADDVSSSKFLVMTQANCVYVANDGRYFNENDVLSLCRSGSSTKQRGGNTIGYRGIGFKAIVNHVNKVHIISGETKFTFSKELTKQLMNSDIDVPLIRVPHLYNPTNVDNDIVNNLIKEKYNTIFIFENSDIPAFVNEIDNFDRSILLFLHKVKEINFIQNMKKTCIKKTQVDDVLVINDGNNLNEWLLISDQNCGIAFKIQNKQVIELDKSESIAYSFMPTDEYVGFPIKINGDFTTDPSRTKIVIDEMTVSAMEIISDLLVNYIQNRIDNNKLIPNLFNVLSMHSKGEFFRGRIKSNSFSSKFVDLLLSKLKQIKIRAKSGSVKELKSFYGLDTTIALSLDIQRKLTDLDSVIMDQFLYNECNKFLLKIGCNTYNFLNKLENLKIYETLDEKECVILLSEIITKKGFCLSDLEIRNIKSIKIIYNDKGSAISFTEYQIDNTIDINTPFFKTVRSYLFSDNELTAFIKALGFSVCESSSKNEIEYKEKQSNNSVFTSNYHKWRSVEQNVAEYFKSLPEVDEVIDVSKNNLGYDLKVISGDKVLKVEVKSVEKLGRAFVLTNNEYTEASFDKENYSIAIVENNEKSFKMILVNNPIDNLIFNKRAVKWEMFCETYYGDLIEVY